MSKEIDYLLKELRAPKKEMEIIRGGLKTSIVDSFLEEEHLAVKDVLARLDIPASTYFTKKKQNDLLDSHATEKFIRLISVIKLAADILGEEEAREWIYRKIPSLDNEQPLNLLDTETGHRLVTQALLQIKHGMYG
jgi:putative toxin-antitoxin system antitoxin component (TIGR02293 family)